VIGTFFRAPWARATNAVINAALTRRCSWRPCCRALGVHPDHDRVSTRASTAFTDLYVSALVGLAVTFLLVAITEYYTGTRWNPVKGDRQSRRRQGMRRNIIEGLAIGMQANRTCRLIVIAARNPRRPTQLLFGRPLRHRGRR